MKKAKFITPVLLAALAFAACGGGTKTEEKTVVKDSVTVTKAETKKPDTVAAAPKAAALSTQSGPKGFQIDLTKADVNGSILTIELAYRPTVKMDGKQDKYSFVSDRVKIADVNYIDDATAKKFTVLKDQEGKPMASPLETNSSDFVSIASDDSGSPVNVYFRFPAPPAGTKTISVSVPGASAFNGIPVTFK